jgi:hypothetical protein
MIPFTAAAFFDVFGAYNAAIWPAQIVAYVLGGAAILLVRRGGDASSALIAGTLALGWLWTGIAYHGMFFSKINPLAPVFAAGFVAEAGALLVTGVLRHQLAFAATRSASAAFGLFLAIYAAILYPAIGSWTGHFYPKAPAFGVTPCPLAIFTFGLLLLTARPVPKLVLVVPVLWSLIGGSAALLLQVPQDWMLPVSGIASLVFLWARDVRRAGFRPARVA